MPVSWPISYTDIVLRGTSVENTVQALQELHRRAYVSPEMDGSVVAYDSECDERGLATLEELAAKLAARLRCPALAFLCWQEDMRYLTHDEDVLLCALYQGDSFHGRYGWGARSRLDHAGPLLTREVFGERLSVVLGIPADAQRIQGLLLRLDELMEEDRRRKPRRSRRWRNATMPWGIHTVLASEHGLRLGCYAGGIGFGHIAACAEGRAHYMTVDEYVKVQ